MKQLILILFLFTLSSCNTKTDKEQHNIEVPENKSTTLSEKLLNDGIQFYSQGEFEKAKQSYKKAIQNSTSNDANVQFSYYIKLITVYLFENDYGNALASLAEYEQKPLEPQIQKQFLTKDTEQYIYTMSGELDKAIEVNDSYYKLAEIAGDSAKITNALIFKSELLDRKGKSEEANEILRDLMNHNDLNPLVKNTVQIKLAIQNYHNANFSEAIRLYKAALLFHKNSDYDGKINAIAAQYANIAEAYIDLNDLQSAKIYLDSFKLLNQEKVDNKLRTSVFKYELRFLKASNSSNQRLESLIDKVSSDQEKFYSDRYNKELELLVGEKAKSEALLIQKQLSDLEKLQFKNRAIMIALLSIIVLLAILFFMFKQRRDFEIDNLKNQQRLLRAQMSPHFIFNVLSSIQNLIRTDVERVPNFITKFSRLLRAVLENSMQNYTSILSEVEVVRNYLDLQQLRFPDIFDYEINIDPDLNDELVKIPPMLIQPFVENAIEHGFKGLKYKGLISLSLKKIVKGKKMMIHCRIVDNGLGFIDYKIKNKKSVSVQLISDFIQKLTGKEIKKSYLDISKKTGTKIEFDIPTN